MGESGGENLDVARENTNEESKGKARFEPGDVIEIPEELADRLDAVWVSQEEADVAEIEPIEDDDSEADSEVNSEDDAEGGDE